MRKQLLTIAVLGSAICAQAQSSLGTALDITEGVNKTKALAIEEMSYKGAYYKYSATETTMLSLSSIDGSNFYFYNADGSSNYDYISSHDENYVYTYAVRVEAGETSYVLATLSYGSDSQDVAFKANIAQGDYLNHGASAEDRVEIISGTTYYFNGQGYLTYLAEQDGVLQLRQPSYSYGASYTVDGVTTEFGFENELASIPVAAGKRYDINVSSYNAFSLTATFAQPQQGDTKENPFTLTLGENVLPAAAQKYYYMYENGEKDGFLTIQAAGTTLAARDAANSYDNLASNKVGEMKLLLSAGQKIIVTVDKAEATAEAQMITATFVEPETGDIEGNPIVLTPSATEVVASAKGVKFYQIANPSEARQFLCVKVLTEGVGQYESSNLKVYEPGQSYQWYGTSAQSGTVEKIQVTGQAVNMLYVNNAADTDMKFSVWYEDIAEGDVYAMPIAAVLGENAAPAGQKYFKYVASQECKLTVTADEKLATVFFPSYADDTYTGKTLLSQEGGVYVLAAKAGEEFIIRITAEQALSFTIEEVAYGEGQTRATAIAFDGTYTFDDMNPYKVWLVYTAPKSGIAVMSADLADVTYDDNIMFALNDGDLSYTNNLRGTDESYNTVMVERTIAVSEGDLLYIQIDVKGYQEGKVLTVSVRDAEPGEGPSNPILIDSAEPVKLQHVGYSDAPAWYTFTTMADGDLTFTATQYVKLALYDENLDIIPVGEYSAQIYTGDYYDPVTVTLPAGTYYLAVETNDSDADLTLTGVELWNGELVGIMNMVADAKASRAYRVDGALAPANAQGLLIKGGKIVLVK